MYRSSALQSPFEDVNCFAVPPDPTNCPGQYGGEKCGLARIIHGLRNKTASTAFKKLSDKDFIQRTEASREYTVCFAV